MKTAAFWGAIAALVVLVLIVALAGCYRDNDPNLPPEAVVFGEGAACGPGCDRAASLGCSEGKASPGGIPCKDVCERAVTTHFRNVHPGCWVDAGSVDDLKKCGLRCVP